MNLDEEYCQARAEYCAVVHRVIDRLEDIKSNPFTNDFIEGVIKATGIPAPYTPDNFEDVMCETIEEYISRLLDDEILTRHREIIKFVENKAPTEEQVTPGSGNATWYDMQNYIHESLETRVVGLTVRYLPESDPLYREFRQTQANYHRVYNLVENSDPQSIHGSADVMDIAADIPRPGTHGDIVEKRAQQIDDDPGEEKPPAPAMN